MTGDKDAIPEPMESSAPPVTPRRHLSMFGRSISLPSSPAPRIGLGVAFIVGGFFAILPVLGLWMIPVGLAILSVDVPPIRRWTQRTSVRLRQRYPETFERVMQRKRQKR